MHLGALAASVFMTDVRIDIVQSLTRVGLLSTFSLEARVLLKRVFIQMQQVVAGILHKRTESHKVTLTQTQQWPSRSLTDEP